jgi:very-short-patch-repair endonuclease
MPTSAALGAAGEFAASHHGVITRSQAAQFGLTPRRVAGLIDRAVLAESLPGVLVVCGSPRTWVQVAYAATQLRSAPALSHQAAAAMHRMDGWTERLPIDVIAGWQQTVGPHAELRVHRSRSIVPADIQMVDGIRCTNLARTLCDLGDVTDRLQLQRALDDVQRRKASLLWLKHTAERLDSPRRPGPRLLLRLLAERSNGYRVPDSWFERLLESCLASEELRDIERQYTVRRPDGSFVARLDLAVPSCKLGIEGHSRSYHLGNEVERADEDRDLELAKLGWEVVYLGFGTTKSPDRTRRDLEAIARTRRAAMTG